MSTSVQFKDSKSKMLVGLNTLADAVKLTLGPSGKTVLIKNEAGKLNVTKDGFSVAKSIELKDELENIGASLIKEVSEQMVKLVGDSTSSSTVLAQELINSSLRYLDDEDQREFFIGMDKTLSHVLGILETKSQKITSEQDLYNVALVSTNYDESISKLIAESIFSVGASGLVSAESSFNQNDELTIIKGGIRLDQGLINPVFITNQDQQNAIHENAMILITDGKINSPQEIFPLLEKLAKLQKPLVLIAEDFDQNVLRFMAANQSGIMKFLPIKAPLFGESRRGLLEDLSVMCGTKVFSEQSGERLDSIQPDQLGTINKITSDKYSTSVIGSITDDGMINYLDYLSKIMESVSSVFDKSKFKERLARLSGAALIKVNANSESEFAERKDRIDDAVAACRAALTDGIIVGSGLSLLRLSTLDLSEVGLSSDSQFNGAKIFLNSITAPFEAIVSNAGASSQYVSSKVLESDDFNYGFNAKTFTYENLMDSGVCDPLSAIKNSLIQAVTTCKLFCSIGGSVVYDKSSKTTVSMKDIMPM